MEDIQKTKLAISIIEGVIFVTLIISSFFAIFDIVSTDFIDYADVFGLLSLQVAIVAIILFIAFPSLIVYFKSIGERAVIKYNQSKFRNKFFDEIKENKSKEINILQFARKYDVNLNYVKNHLRNQISEGLLKGDLKNDVFFIHGDFEVKDLRERRIEFMKQNIGRFVSPHRSIKIREISSNFKVPRSITMLYIKKLINEEILRGYLVGETFIRDLSLPETCPHCNKKIDLIDNANNNS